MIRFVYPNVLPEGGVGSVKDIGCGRFVAAQTKPDGYSGDDPKVTNVTDILEIARIMLNSENIFTHKSIFEIRDSGPHCDKFNGDSMTLAYLLTAINCNYDFYPAFNSEMDIWCTGEVTYDKHRLPILRTITPNEFKGKLCSFSDCCKYPHEVLFFVPRDNITNGIKAEYSDIRFVNLSEINIYELNVNLTRVKTVIGVGLHELKLLMLLLFPETSEIYSNGRQTLLQSLYSKAIKFKMFLTVTVIIILICTLANFFFSAKITYNFGISKLQPFIPRIAKNYEPNIDIDFYVINKSRDNIFIDKVNLEFIDRKWEFDCKEPSSTVLFPGQKRRYDLLISKTLLKEYIDSHATSPVVKIYSPTSLLATCDYITSPLNRILQNEEKGLHVTLNHFWKSFDGESGGKEIPLVVVRPPAGAKWPD